MVVDSNSSFAMLSIIFVVQNIMKKQSPIMVSLFTGAGGLDEGFKAAGCEIRACLELESWACETLNFNNPTTNVIQGNIK